MIDILEMISPVRHFRQVYHLCTSRGGRRAFFCPEGTRFNQRSLVCDHERRVECAEAGEFFHKNVVLHQESLRATGKARQSE